MCLLPSSQGSSNNETTTPKSVHDMTTPTENFAGFIINNLVKITIFAKYFYTFTLCLWVKEGSSAVDADTSGARFNVDVISYWNSIVVFSALETLGKLSHRNIGFTVSYHVRSASSYRFCSYSFSIKFKA